MFPDSAEKCVVFLPPFLFKIPRLSALVPRNMGWPLSAKMFDHLIGFIVPLSLWLFESMFRNIFLHFLDRGMTNVLAEIFLRKLSLLWNSKHGAMNFHSVSKTCRHQ